MAALRQCFRSFHTTGAIHIPRAISTPTKTASTFGTYDRLRPKSLQLLDVSKWQRREVPSDIAKPVYADSGEPNEWEGHIPILSNLEIEKLSAAGDLARRVLDMGGKLCQVCKHSAVPLRATDSLS